MKIFKYIAKIAIAFVLTPLLLIVINYLTDDYLIKSIVNIQDSNIYKNFFIYTNPCIDNISNDKVKDKTLFFNQNLFSNSLGSCYVDKMKDINKVEMDINFGGRITSALIFAREIEKNNIEVKIKSECFSACVDILMTAKTRLVCKNAIIGIHQQSAKIDDEFISRLINGYLIKNNRYSIEKFRKNGINVDLLSEIIKETPNDQIYELSEKELLETGVATKIIKCEINN